MRLRSMLLAACLLLHLPLAGLEARPALGAAKEGRTRASSAAGSRARRVALERGLARIDFQSVFRAPKVTATEASRLVTRARQRLGVDFRLEWDNPSTAIFVDKGKPVVLPRGLVQATGMTRDGLALILAHEAAHIKGHGKEGPADYWAARFGLRKLLGKPAFSGRTPKRPLLAAFSALRSQFTEEFDLVPRGRREIVIQATGYPTVQSRWEIFKAGIAGRTMPRTTRREPEGEPELFTLSQAATYLAVSPDWLKQQTKVPGGPVQVDVDGPHFIKDNLDQFRARALGPRSISVTSSNAAAAR